MTLRIAFRTSPNQNARPARAKVSCILLHIDESASAQSTVEYLCKPETQKSYHFLVARDGGVFQLVPTNRRAWHAGESARRGVPDVNDYSVGVCFSNDGKEPFDPRAIAAGVELVADLCRQFALAPRDAIDRHSAVALPPGRRSDPGPHFPFDDFVARVAGQLAGTRPAP